GGRDVLGRSTYRSLAELPGPVELVVLAVSGAALGGGGGGAPAAGGGAVVGLAGGRGGGRGGGGAGGEGGGGRGCAPGGGPRGRRPARPQLPGRLRRCRRAGSRLGRVRCGSDRARVAERQHGAGDLAARVRGRARGVALRVAREPGGSGGGGARRRARRSR